MKSLEKQLILLFLLVGSIGYGQGMMVHAGATSMKSGLASLTPEGTAHTGYHLGADGRLGDDDFYFMIGLQYHKLNFDATDKFELQPVDLTYNLMKGKGGFAFKVLRVNDDIVARLRVMGMIDYILNVPALDTEKALTNMEFNEAVAGLGGGLEVDVYFMTLNLEYQKGFFNSVKETKGSSLDFLTLSLGVNF